MKIFFFLLSVVLFFGTNLSAQSTILNIEIRDKGSGQIVPARVEVADIKGNYFVAENALLVGGDCNMIDLGKQRPLNISFFADKCKCLVIANLDATEPGFMS